MGLGLRSVHERHASQMLVTLFQLVKNTGPLDTSVTAGVPDEGKLPRARLSRPRRMMVHTILAVIVVGHVAALFTNLELWPFSPYPMYADSRAEYTLVNLDLFAVPATAPEQEFVVWGEAYFRPLTHYHVRGYLAWLNARGEDDAVRDVLAATLDHYEVLRVQRQHDGPPLRALRLYRANWRLDGESVPASSPVRKVLIAEARHEPQ